MFKSWLIWANSFTRKVWINSFLCVTLLLYTVVTIRVNSNDQLTASYTFLKVANIEAVPFLSHKYHTIFNNSF
jgi:hypothetical protein